MRYGLERRPWIAAALALAAACSSSDGQGMLSAGFYGAGSGDFSPNAGSGGSDRAAGGGGGPIAGRAGTPSVPPVGHAGMDALAGAAGAALAGSGGMVPADAGVDPGPDAAIPAGPFPRPDVATIDSLSADRGPYAFATYTDLPASPSYSSAIVYHPTDAEPPFAAVALCPGFTDTQIDVDWWGPRLASHAIVVLILSTITTGDQPPVRAEALQAAIETLRAESARQGSPLLGRIDLMRLGLVGHSMGGGGTLIAADALGNEIRAAVPLMPWSVSPQAFPNITAPTMVMTGEVDTTANPTTMGYAFYTSIPSSTEKVYVEVAGGQHNIGKNPGLHHDIVGRYAVAWLKLYLEDDERYRALIYGMVQQDDLAANRLSRFEAGR